MSYPGIHLREIHRLSGVDLSLVEYHANQLEAEELVISIKQEGYRRFFSVKTPEQPLTQDERRVLATLRREGPFAIVSYLLESGPARNRDIAEGTGLSRPAVSYHLKKLLDADIVERERAGDDRRYHLADPDRLRRLLRFYEPTPDMIDAYGELWDEVYRDIWG